MIFPCPAAPVRTLRGDQLAPARAFAPDGAPIRLPGLPGLLAGTLTRASG